GIDDRHAGAAVFLRPVDGGVTGVGLAGLPFLRAREGVFLAQAADARDLRGILFLFGVLVEPGPDLGAELGLLGRILEIHRETPCVRPKAPDQAAWFSR